MNKKWIAIFICAVVLACICIHPTQSVQARQDPPDDTGSYLVGYTHLVVLDESRNPEIGGRPIAVDLWYPADPTNQGNPLLPAEYEMDPYNVLGAHDNGWGTVSSSLWEDAGLDPAYQEPAPFPNQSFPLLLFSFGWGNNSFDYLFLGPRVASHGFVVALVSTYGDTYPDGTYDHSAVAALNRMLDARFLITEFLTRDMDPDDPLYGMINEDQIAMSGHSWGGYASLALAAGDVELCDTFYGDPYEGDPPPEACGPVLPDPRIKAIVTLDGSNQNLHFQELAQVTIPAMGIGEEWTTLTGLFGPENASWQARQHAAMQGHPNYRVDVAYAEHGSFTDWCETVEVAYDINLIDEGTYQEWKCSPEPISSAEIERLTTMYLIAFLKVNLVGDHEYQSLLTPGYALAHEPNIEFFVTEKRNPHAIDEDWPDDFVYFMHQPGSEQARGPKNPQDVLQENRAPRLLQP